MKKKKPTKQQDIQPGEQVAAGLYKLALVLRHQSWQSAGQRGLTPTQSQIVALLASQMDGARVMTVAKSLSITKGTASEAISTLVKKKLIEKQPDSRDGRIVRLKLTRSGKKEAQHSVQWPEVVVQAIDALPKQEQAGFIRGLVGLIGNLQDQGAVPTSRMCVECRFFRPNNKAGQKKPHRCDFINAQISDVELRLDCAEMEPAPEELRPDLIATLFQTED